MMTFIDIDADHVVGMKIDGKITGQEFDVLMALMVKRMKDHPKYSELLSFKGFSFEAFFKDVTFALSNLDRLAKEAIVAESLEFGQ